MTVRIEAHAEPIPGYRLIERLGSGGFGEVWKAEAPGGLFKAIKFVQHTSGNEDACAIGNPENDRSRADQELKSLSRVKSVHHPYVISLDRFEIVDNYLVIVMELADRTLSDRFKQCRAQGLPGVPRDELLGYLEEAAEALDLMNGQYQLQHLDIKPQNLFLVHNHIKVADFGLVKDIGDQKFMTITGGVTPVYAAPETFDGKFSRQSDQYSLAIVYQEILTGHRPFTGTTMKQLILQHLQNAHDLSPAPVHDRPIIGRALSKNPEDRFPTCLDFVNALRRLAVKGRPGDDRGRQIVPPPPPSSGNFPSVSRTIAARGVSGPVKTVAPNFSVEKDFLSDDAKPAENVAPIAPPELSLHTVPTPVTSPRAKKEPPPRPSVHDCTGIVQPALVVGLGNVGIQTLVNFRGRIAMEFGSPMALPSVRLLAIDTDPESMHEATLGNDAAALRTQETVLARLQRASHYLKTRDGKLPTDGWLNPKLLYRIPRDQHGAGLRALGRLAFIDNYRALAKRFESELQALASHDTPHDSAEVCDLGLRTTKPRVYLVTSLTGNTGSGMVIDVAYLLRRLLDDLGHADTEIIGILLVPEVKRDAAAAIPLANAHAAMIELQHYCRVDAVYSAQFGTAASIGKADGVTIAGPALQRCLLLPLGDFYRNPKSIDNSAAVALAGDFLYRDLATTLGSVIEKEHQAAVLRAEENSAAATPLHSIDIRRIIWPRHALLEQSARRLSAQLVARWMSKDAKPFADRIRKWTDECWETLGLRPENLIERFQQMSEASLQQKPEQLLAEILAPASSMLDNPSRDPAKAKPGINMGPIVQAMDRLERVVGIPDEVRGTKTIPAEAPLLERAFADIAHVIADECEQRLAELAVTLLEDPHYRLAGAEEALRQFNATVEKALQSQEILAKELAEKAAHLHVRIQQWIDKPLPANAPSPTQWSFGRSRKNASEAGAHGPAELFELLRTYTKTRYHSIVLAHLNRLYLGLRGHLSDQIREVGFCRQRLGELHDLLNSAPAASTALARDDRALFSPGCLNLKDSVEQLFQGITPSDLIAFDERMQQWIRQHCQALLQVCMGTSTTIKNLTPAMLQEAEGFLSERVVGVSVAEMYLARKRIEHGEQADAEILNDLQRCLDDATPEFGRLKEGNEATIITLPDGPHGLELQKLLERECKNALILMTERQDEMIFYHDIVAIPWKDLDLFGPIAQEFYASRSVADPLALHTREDVFDSQIIAATK